MALRGSLVTSGTVCLSGSIQAASTQFNDQINVATRASVTGALAVGASTMLSGGLFLKSMTAPSVQASNESVLYSKSGNLYWKNAGGSEQQVGTGGGAAEVGWTGPANNQITTTGSLTANQQLNVGGNASITGSAYFSGGLSGSLTRLVNGTSFLAAGDNITIASASNGQVTISGLAGDITGVTAGTGLTGGGSSGDVTVAIDDSIVATVSGTQFTGQVGFQDNLSVTGSSYFSGGLSGSLTRLIGGTSYLAAGSNITITSASNGQVTISGLAGDITGVTAGTGLTGGGSSGDVTLAADDSVVATLTGSQFTGQVGFQSNLSVTGSAHFAAGLSGSGDTTFSGPVYLSGSVSDFTATGSASFNAGLSGSLTRLIGGTSYLAAGSNVTITSASNGQVTIASSGGGGGAPDVGWTAPAADQISTTGSLALAANQRLYFNGQSGDQSIYGNGATVYFDCDDYLFLYTDGSIKIYTGGFIFNENGLNADFRVETDNLPGAILTDGYTDQVILGSAGTTAATAGAPTGSPAGSDVLVYISGSVGSAGVASSKGTTMVAGDMHVSGAIYNGMGGEVTPVLTQCLIDGSSVAYQEITNNETTQYRITWDLGDTSATDPYVTFTAPESGQVLVYVQSYIDDTSSSGGGPTIFMALSTSSATSIAYNDASIVGSEKRLWYPDEADDIIITTNFLATGLTPGNSYTYYPFLRRWDDAETNRVICGANYPMFMMEVRPVTADAVIYNS